MGKEEKGKTRYAISEKDVIYEGGSCGGGRGRGIGSNQRSKSRPPPMCPRLSLSLSLLYIPGLTAPLWAFVVSDATFGGP